jgi:hypothetical protein
MDSRLVVTSRAGGLLHGGAVMDLIAAFTIGLAFGTLASIIIVWIAAAWDSHPTDAEFYGDNTIERGPRIIISWGFRGRFS